MSAATSKATVVRQSGRFYKHLSPGDAGYDADATQPQLVDEIPIYWNQAPEYITNTDGLPAPPIFGVFTFEFTSSEEAAIAFDGRAHTIDWVFVADSAQEAADAEERCFKNLSRNLTHSTHVNTGIIPESDKTLHFARRRFSF